MQYDFSEIKRTLEGLEQKKKEAEQVQKILTAIQEEIKSNESKLIRLMGLQSQVNADTKPEAPAATPAPRPNKTQGEVDAYALHPRFKLARISDAQLLEWRKNGWSKTKIAKHVGVTWGTVFIRLASLENKGANP